MKKIIVNQDNYKKYIDEIYKRSAGSYDDIDKTVADIIVNVRENGDKALLDYTQKFDKVNLSSLKISQKEIDEAVAFVGEKFIKILEKAKENIWYFHAKQEQKSWMDYSKDGIVLGQKITPIQRVGVYVPGGKALYPSSVLMNVIPAKVAGVPSIAMVSPPNKSGNIDPYILAAAHIAGVDEIYKVGGAQAIAALAYGTESIAPVYKIVGPGNIYVARAKAQVFGRVNIDMIAGPSEVCVIADSSADAVFVAADMLSQAEHDEMAACVLITDSHELANMVLIEIDKQMNKLEKKEIMQKSTTDYGVCFIVDNMQMAITVANEFASEHLEIMTENPFSLLPKVKNAGAIFLGKYSPEPLGDYFAGPNHTLPTNGTAKFSSPLSVDDFIKKSSVIYYEEDALKAVKDNIIEFATHEGLTAHANSIKVRYEK